MRKIIKYILNFFYKTLVQKYNLKIKNFYIIIKIIFYIKILIKIILISLIMFKIEIIIHGKYHIWIIKHKYISRFVII